MKDGIASPVLVSSPLLERIESSPLKVEISFDDGHVSDIRASRLLQKYGFKGTFYNSNRAFTGIIKMDPMEISREILKRGHELGGHTISHPPDIKLMDDESLKFELENVRYGTPLVYRNHFPQREMTKFCYPRGRHDERVRKAVADAGYTYARTTRVLHIRNDKGDPLQSPTTIQMFDRKEYNGRDWYDLALEYFDRALEESKFDKSVYFHLWGHSKELDQYDQWEKFEKTLAHMAGRLGYPQPADGANGANDL